MPDDIRDAAPSRPYRVTGDLAIPADSEQLQFLKRIQRLFEEGDFTATYKYALLTALVEIAVESGDDSGAPLVIPRLALARKFAEYYWPQTLPFTMNDHHTQDGVLSQNLGRQAAVINALRTLRETGAWTLGEAARLPGWEACLRTIERTVYQMPVRYLQNMGGTSVEFLYSRPRKGEPLVLLPGVAFMLRRFQGFLQQWARSGWLAHVRGNSRNAQLLGESVDLEAFMFQPSRQDLVKVGKLLRKLQNGRCFYCDRTLRSSADVDHFIPWAQYPRDTAHNFVLAHATCNRSKRDALAGKIHLDSWLQRNDRYRADIAGEMVQLGFVADSHRSWSISRWAYANAIDIGANAWVRADCFEPVDESFLRLLSR